MAITVSPLLTLIDDAEDGGLWTGGTDNSDVRKQGVSSVGAKVSNTLGGFAFLTADFTSINLSTGDHLFWWVLVSGVLDTIAAGGIRIRLYSGLLQTDYRTWYVGGSDNYSGGWKCFCLDPTAAGSEADSGTYNSASVINIGIAFKTIAKVSGNASNCFWDISRYGSGLRVTSAAADAVTWEDIYAVDDNNANAYGVIIKQNGTYIMQGKVIFGNSASAADIDFYDTNSLCLWQANAFQSTALNEIRVEGNSGTDTINFVIGNKVGTGDSAVGASGNLIRALDAVNQPWKLDLSNPNIDVANIYGSTLSGMSSSTIANSVVEMITVTVDSSAQLAVGTANIFNSTVSNSLVTTGAVLLPSGDTHVMRKMAFNNNNRAIEIDTFFSGGYTFNNMIFSGNTFDVNNTSGSTQEVKKTSGANPSTYTGTLVNYTASFAHTITGLEFNTEVTYVTAGTSTELFSIENATTSDGNGKYQISYTHAGGASVDVLILHTSYKPDISNIYGLTLPNASSSSKVSMFPDENYVNP